MVYENAFWDYAIADNALISNEYLNLRYDSNGLIDGSNYTYSPRPTPSVSGLPPKPNCSDAYNY